MTGALLLIPFICIRFLILSLLNKESLKRAVHFAPMSGKKQIAYWVYQLSNLGIFKTLFFSDYQVEQTVFYYFSATVYVIGVIMLRISITYFAFLSREGLNTKGIYRFSRNPMYVSYFVYFIACALLTESWILLSLTVVLQLSAHWIILSEEKWCIESFGNQYIEYMNEVRRYF